MFMIQTIKTVFNKLFRLQQWYVGWAKAPLSHFLEDPLRIRFNWIVPQRKTVFIADPFGLETPEGDLIILAEKLVQGRSHGEIISIDTRHSLPPYGVEEAVWKPLLRKPWHLSYPFIVQEGADRYVLPEQGASNSVSAYRLDECGNIDPHPAWTVQDCPALDTTPFFHEGRWWLFSVRRGQPYWGGPLLLHFADQLSGPWQPHPMNPVVTDHGHARPGGRIARIGGRLFRPAQDCSRVYGAALVINEIVQLTPTVYEERVSRRVRPEDLGAPDAVGCHHLDHTASYLLVDAMRYVYHPLAWWFKWRS
jgi:hypothetical protein